MCLYYTILRHQRQFASGIKNARASCDTRAFGYAAAVHPFDQNEAIAPMIAMNQ